jgi:hypothetical protein
MEATVVWLECSFGQVRMAIEYRSDKVVVLGEEPSISAK